MSTRAALLKSLAPARAWDAVRSRLWPLPVFAVIVAFSAGVAIPRLDDRIDGSLPPRLDSALFTGDSDAARSVLTTVAGSLITVTSLTFSLTVVTLQLASSQFSPRLLRTFTSDVFVQATLGLFLGTFTYALTVLRAVRSVGDAQTGFVPRIAVTVSYVLALVSVVGLVVFLAHLARQIRVETMLKAVHADASSTIAKVLTDQDRYGEPLPDPDHGIEHVFAASSGFLIGVDDSALLAAASDADVCIVISREPGASLVRGAPIGWIRLLGPSLGRNTRDALDARISSALTVGYERTGTEDIGYGLRQLTDVANKALSPGINDPTTAVYALGHISSLLCEIAALDPGPVALRDGDGTVRVILRRPDLDQLVDDAITQPRRYGATDPLVLCRLFQMLEELARCAGGAAARTVPAQLPRLNATAKRGLFDEAERHQFAIASQRVAAALAEA